MYGAVGVFVTEENRTRSVIVQVCGAVQIGGYDGVAADIADGVSGRSDNVHQAGHGIAPSFRHIGDDIRQCNVEGEGPRMGVSSAVGVRIVIDDVALTSVETSAVNSDIASCKCVATGIGDHRHGDAVGGDSI